MLVDYLGLPGRSEILIIIFVGICFLSLDFSLFQLKSNLHDIWKIELERLKYLETIIKYLISVIVIVRTFTLHAFLACYIVMLWPAIFEEKPNLMLPWLLLGILRCLIINAITLALGLIICQLEKGISPICFEYVFAQIIEHGPSVYAWMSVLSFYRRLIQRHGSLNSSAETLMSNESHIESLMSYTLSEKGSLHKVKSYSLSDLNMDYLCSSRARILPPELSIEIIINDIKDLFSQKRIIRNGSKSFDSLNPENIDQQQSTHLQIADTHSDTPLEKSKKMLNVTDQDIQKAKLKKNRFIEILKHINIDDVRAMDHKIYMQKSNSLTDDAENREICLCYLKKQLQLEESNQTLFESEIANITFSDNPEGGKGCNIKKNILPCNVNLNQYRVEEGSKFLGGYAIKKKNSRNFGCQVSTFKRAFFEKSRNGLVRNIMNNFTLP